MTAVEDDHLAEMQAVVDDLGRRVDDLRAFEREYRARLIAYLENLARELREGTQ